MAVTQFKKGDTFVLNGSYRENGAAAALPAGVRAQIRGESDTLVAELTISRDDEAGGLYSAQVDTANWPLGMVYLDVLYTYASGVKSRTPTVRFMIVQAVTHD